MPHVYLTQSVAYMIRKAVTHDPKLEVGGLLRVECQKDEEDNPVIVVTGIAIPPQRVGSAHFDVTANDFVTAIGTMAQKVAKDEKKSLWDVYRGIWHSHGTMGVSPSATDIDQLEALATDEKLSWMIGLVVNMHGEMHCWLDVTVPVFVTCKLEVSIMPPDMPQLDGQIEEMMKGVKPARLPVIPTIGPVMGYGYDDGPISSAGKCHRAGITSDGVTVYCHLYKGHKWEHIATRLDTEGLVSFGEKKENKQDKRRHRGEGKQ